MLAMCWKCANRITEPVKDGIQKRYGVMTLVGCKAAPSIEGFDDAQEKCPLIQKDKLTKPESGV